MLLRLLSQTEKYHKITNIHELCLGWYIKGHKQYNVCKVPSKFQQDWEMCLKIWTKGFRSLKLSSSDRQEV